RRPRAFGDVRAAAPVGPTICTRPMVRCGSGTVRAHCDGRRGSRRSPNPATHPHREPLPDRDFPSLLRATAFRTRLRHPVGVAGPVRAVTELGPDTLPVYR